MKTKVSIVAAICAAGATAGAFALGNAAPASPAVTASAVHPALSEEPLALSVGGVSFKMLPVQGGTFLMGSEEQEATRPVHEVTVGDFYIGETEVTQALWEEVMGSNPAHFKGATLPVESVTLADCRAFAARLGERTGRTFRLPTEAEWEYAARGGRKAAGTRYAGSDDLETVAWIDNADRPQPVAQLAPNELGAYDMSGNVCEWCSDIYDTYPAGPQVNPTGAATGLYHPARGGGWNRGGKFCLVFDRGNYRPEYASNAVGLRLVMEP